MVQRGLNTIYFLPVFHFIIADYYDDARCSFVNNLCKTMLLALLWLNLHTPLTCCFG